MRADHHRSHQRTRHGVVDTDLDLVCDKLNITLPEETLAEFATISGYLGQQAGEIPENGDIILVGALRFDVREADERRLLSVRACRRALALCAISFSDFSNSLLNMTSLLFCSCRALR